LTPISKRSLRTGLTLIRRGDFRTVLQELWRRCYSEQKSYCLIRDLSVAFTAPDARVAITVRPLTPNDVTRILGLSDEQHSTDAYDRIRRLRLVKYGIPTCYVAVTEDGDPCFMQWLIGHEENERVGAFFGGEYPPLGQQEMLMENAFTPERYRGMGIMPCAMSRIAEIAITLNARRIHTYVHESNIASLKGCKRAGFVPHLMRTERWRFFRKKYLFELLPTGTPYPFD
jgi:RimJ/RimL family protein N-acetyltransferase